MREYFHRPEETAKTLRDGWVATGGMCRLDDGGHLHLMCRKKDMVLSGGYNIYSKEVEQAMQAHPAVRDAAVIGVPDHSSGEAAPYVELDDGAHLDAQGVIDHCKERIASYKKPKYVFFVATLPRTSTGRVMKTQLRALLRRNQRRLKAGPTQPIHMPYASPRMTPELES